MHESGWRVNYSSYIFHSQLSKYDPRFVDHEINGNGYLLGILELCFMHFPLLHPTCIFARAVHVNILSILAQELAAISFIYLVFTSRIMLT